MDIGLADISEMLLYGEKNSESRWLEASARLN